MMIKENYTCNVVNTKAMTFKYLSKVMIEMSYDITNNILT